MAYNTMPKMFSLRQEVIEMSALNISSSITAEMAMGDKLKNVSAWVSFPEISMSGSVLCSSKIMNYPRRLSCASIYVPERSKCLLAGYKSDFTLSDLQIVFSSA